MIILNVFISLFALFLRFSVVRVFRRILQEEK
jgi:hypothetical protein